MGRTPWSPQSLKHDTMGVGFNPNCPDRSWCVAQVGPHKTKRRHRSGKQEHSPSRSRNAGTERKKLRDQARGKKLAQVGIDNPPLSRATALHSVALRAANIY